MPVCGDEEVMDLATAWKKITQMTENEIYNETGCLSSCNKDELRQIIRQKRGNVASETSIEF